MIATRGRVAGWLPPVALFVIVIAAWEGASVLFGIQSFLLPRPSIIAGRIVALWPDTLARGLLFTATEALVGLLTGLVLGTGVGLLAARFRTARETLLPVAIGASTVPIIAFAPITINWFGPESLLPRTIIVAAMVFFPVMVNTIRGLTQVEPAALELLQSYAATQTQVLRQVRIPNAVPYWFTALRIATTLSVIGAVVGEFFGGPLYSLGIFITNRTGVSNYPDAWAAIVLACLLGISLYLGAALLERIALPWGVTRENAR
jgi:NitT/TauT family transport system permease protein